MKDLIRGGSARQEHGDHKPPSPSEQLQALLTLKPVFGGPGSSPEDGGLTAAILSALPQSPDVHSVCSFSILGLVCVSTLGVGTSKGESWQLLLSPEP